MSKVIKKYFIAFLAAVCLTCLGFAVACSKEPNYYVLNFENAEGIEYICEISDGYEVRDGAEVSFTLDIAENVIGEPLVRANDDEITADENGVYKFVMKEQTKVTVSNTYMLHDYKITFDAGDNRVQFLNENGENLDIITADEGTVVKFKLKVSVYHDRTADFDVVANNVILKPADGVYSFTVTNDTRVGIGGEGIAIAEGFINRANCGSGTREDPYLIKEPVDLYYMRELINNDFNSGRFGAAHYRLEADLDLEGEQVYVLGDGTVSGTLSQLSYFSGSFDGNGHTISNYYISDVQHNAEYNEVSIPYVGLFGLVNASTESAVEIKDLHLKNFTINVDGAQNGGFSFFAGGIVGYGVGVNITGCTAEGVISMNGPEANDRRMNVGYAGGVAGYITSAYGNETTKYNSSVVATGSDVELKCESGVMYAAGGLVGVLDSSDDKATSYILNSYAINNVSGAIYTGGLVGIVGAYASVKNSYFAGSYVEANSRIPDSANFGRYAHSYGGGIAGSMSYESVISECFTSGEVSAYSYTEGNFAHKGEIAGYRESAGAYTVEASGAAVINSHFNSSSATLNKQYALNTLNWVEGDWNFDGSLPVPAGAPEGQFVLTIDYNGNQVDGGDTETITLSGDRNMAQLYENYVILQYIKSGNLLSYGYYFDKACTERVPFGYVPSGNVTLYVGFADYNEVAGRYYITGGNGAYFDLIGNGTLFYRNGALSHTSYYYYDGTKITMIESAAFEVLERQTTDEDTYSDNIIYFCAIANIDSNGALSMVNIADGYNGYAVPALSHYYTSSSPLTAVKELENFVYGTYYNGTTQYTFNEDGTGSYGTSRFTYTVNGTTLTTSAAAPMNRGVVNADGVVTSLGNVNLTKYDPFRGVWENAASSHKRYSFDGLGGYTYEYFGYVKSGNDTVTQTIESYSGTYTVDNGKITLGVNGEQITFDDNGFLSVNFGTHTETYYMQNSFAGEWRFFNTDEAVGLKLNGISNIGYGTGLVSYGANVSDLVIEYEAVNVVENGDNFTELLIYSEDSLLGRLRYTVGDNTLRGEMYSYYYNMARSNVIFCMYDDFRGKWISEQFGLIEFNGLGNYNLGGGTTGIIRTRGEVTVNGKSAGNYTLEGYNLKGTFVYDGKTYEIEYDEATKLIKVTESQTHFNLVGLDPLYDLTLVSESGDKYVFNGGGYLAGGGEIKKNGEAVYGYKTVGGEVEIYALGGSEKIGEFGVADNAYVLTADETEIKLTYDNLFTGSWVVGGQRDGALVIGKIGADLTASGSYLGTNVTFSYDLESEVLSFNGQGGEKLFVYVFTAQGVTELKVGVSNLDVNSVICVKEQNVSPLKGTYNLADNKTIYLDGMNESKFGKGTAVLRDGESVKLFTYKTDGKNVVLTGNGAYILLIDGGNGELVTPDALFDVRVWDSRRINLYRFDGMGTVTMTSGTQEIVYSYVIDSYDEVSREYKLTLTDEEGKTYAAVYVFTGNAYITVTANQSAQ